MPVLRWARTHGEVVPGDCSELLPPLRGLRQRGLLWGWTEQDPESGGESAPWRVCLFTLWALLTSSSTRREKYSLEQDIREKEEALRQKTSEVQVSTALLPEAEQGAPVGQCSGRGQERGFVFLGASM